MTSQRAMTRYLRFHAVRASLAILLAVAFLLMACGPFQDRDAAERTVDRFHQLFNEASYSVIYYEAEARFRRSTTVPDFDQLLLAVRRSLGTFKQARRMSFRSDAGPDGTVATLVYESDFTEGKATEEFRYATREGRAYLITYNISSPLLKVR